MEFLLLAHRAEELGVLEVCVGVLVRGMCAYVCVCVGVSLHLGHYKLPCEGIGDTMW